MPKKPVFMMSLRGMDPLPTPYTPMIYCAGSESWRFALHKVGRHWTVSDPRSGARICTVTALYKGMPVASGALTQRQAMECAAVDIDAIVARMGVDRFSAVLAAQKPN